MAGEASPLMSIEVQGVLSAIPQIGLIKNKIIYDSVDNPSFATTPLEM